MTRINCVHPRELCDKHLLAELNELPRIFTKADIFWKTRQDVGSKLPTAYCLGTGHMKFFYNKLKYLHSRYGLLHLEATLRGFNVKWSKKVFISLEYIDLKVDKFWQPNLEDIRKNRERIAERIWDSMKSKPKFTPYIN
jgi:hypothetical protein